MINRDVVVDYLEHMKKIMGVFPVDDVLYLASFLLSMPQGATLYVIGNGGSATTASHMATDLGVGSMRKKNPIRVISLSENVGILTATGNDVDFSSIYSAQIRLLGSNRDALLCFSASGKSKNLLNAVQTAKEIGMTTIAVTGFDGGSLKTICDISIHVPTRVGDYGFAEDFHLIISHMVTNALRSA